MSGDLLDFGELFFTNNYFFLEKIDFKMCNSNLALRLFSSKNKPYWTVVVLKIVYIKRKVYSLQR